MQSSSDIAAWIEERRKKFPTKARAAEMAERGRQRENAQEAANQARKEAQEKQQAEAKERRKKKEGAEGKRKKSKDDPADVAARAKRKVEKLRKQLEKEERRAAKAEAKASNKKLDVDAEEIADQAAHQMDGGKKRKRSASDASESTMIGDTRNAEPTQSDTMITANETTSILPTKMGLNETPILETAILNFQGKPRESVSMVSDPLTPMSQPPISDDQADPSPTTLDLNHAVLETGAVDDQNHEKAISLAASNTKLPQDSSSPTSESSSDISSTDSEDLTSSSGSPSSDANSDEDAPDHFSSKRNGPEKVAPPKRTQKISICHEFLKNGRCRKGDRCKWRHELPERGSRGADKKDIIKPEERKERVGLYQRVRIGFFIQSTR